MRRAPGCAPYKADRCKTLSTPQPDARLKHGRRGNPYHFRILFPVILNFMRHICLKIEAAALPDLIALHAEDERDRAGEHVAEFLAFMRTVFPRWSSPPQDAAGSVPFCSSAHSAQATGCFFRRPPFKRSAAANVTFSSSRSLKNSRRSVPRHSRISISVAIEGK